MKSFSLCFLLSLSFIAFKAETAYSQRFEGGVVAGFNMSQLDGDDLVGYNQIGFNAGIKADAVLNERWRLTLEMIFSQQGSDRAANDALSAAFDNIRLNFVEAPILVSFRDWKFQVGTGITIGRMINFKAVDSLGTDVTDLQDYNPNLISWLGDVVFFFEENIGLNVRWSVNINSVRADEGAGRLAGRIVTIRGIYMF